MMMMARKTSSEGTSCSATGTRHCQLLFVARYMMKLCDLSFRLL